MTFNRLVCHNLEIFDVEKFDYLVTSCATCTSTIKKIWPMMANKDSNYIKSKIEKIAQQTLDINQFLVSIVGLEKVEYKGGKWYGRNAFIPRLTPITHWTEINLPGGDDDK